jgi:hypothetical protein
MSTRGKGARIQGAKGSRGIRPLSVGGSSGFPSLGLKVVTPCALALSRLAVFISDLCVLCVLCGENFHSFFILDRVD